MKEPIANLKTSQLAKEKGFDWECTAYTCKRDGDCFNNTVERNFNEVLNSVSRPTQSLLQKWLRKEHGINVIVIPDTVKPDIYTCTLFMNYTIKGAYIEKSIHISNIKNKKGIITWILYEKALEAGLQEALKLIK